MHKEVENFSSSPIFEGMTSIRAVLAAMAAGSPTNNRRIVKILYAEERIKKIGKEVAYLGHRGNDYGFPVLPVSEEEINRITTGNTHGGIVAFCTERDIPDLSMLTDPPKNGFYCMIEGIEDPYNFGYALRSLYACGVDGIILPKRNWMSAAGVVARASAGASEELSLFSAAPLFAASYFRKKGYKIVAADADTSISLPNADLKKPIFLVIGGEKRGISGILAQEIDFTVKIPYGRPFNAALSAASAATIFGYEILRQNVE